MLNVVVKWGVRYVGILRMKLSLEIAAVLHTDWGLIPPTTCNLCCVNGMPGILIGVRCNTLGQYATISQCFPCSGAVIVS